MSKYDINEAFIQALQEQEQEDAKNTVLKLSDKMKEIPVKKGSITATPSIERTMRTAKDRRDKKQEEASITVTQDVNNEEEALDLVNDSSYFKVGDEVEVKDWNGKVYKVTKTKDYKYKNGKRVEEDKKEEILDIDVNANDIGSNNNTNVDLGGLGDLGSLLGEEKKEELFNVNIDAGDIASNNNTSLDLGGIGALAGLLASEEVKEDDDKLEEDTEEYLEPRYDTRNSFYKKAKVVTKDNGDEELYSYGTHVGGVRGGKPYSKGRFSQTTSRHQKEFFKQRDINPNDVEVEESKKTEDVEYISKKDLDDMPAEYKSTVKDTIDAEVWKGNDRKKVTQMYKDLGYDEDDPMILASDTEKGTILKPVKVKEEALDVPKDTYWEGKGKYKELTDKINAKLLPSSGTDAKVQGIIPDNLFKQYVELQNKYYRFYNDGELPFRKTSAGWNATKSALDYDLKNQFDSNIDKPVLAQVGSDLENKMNGLIAKILKVVPDLETKLDNIDKEEKTESKLQEVDVDSNGEVETITGLHTDLFRLVNMNQYQVGDNIVCSRQDLDDIMIKHAKPIIEGAFEFVLPSAKVTFGEFTHPRYYRAFSGLNDQLLFDVTFNKNEYEEVKEETINDPGFAEYIAKNYCSYDGFISYMADNMEDFNNQEEWRQFVQVVQYNMPEFEESQYNDYLEEVYNDLLDNFLTEDYLIEDTIEQLLDDTSIQTEEDIANWIVKNNDIPEGYDLDWVVSEIKSELDDKRGTNNTEDTKEESFVTDVAKDNIELGKTVLGGLTGAGLLENEKTKKTEEIDEENEDEEDDSYGETISLLAIAYRDIPEVGVEDWGKNNELKFCLDIRKVLSDLEGFEEEIPKKLYDEASPDDWSNGVEEYLEVFKGVDINSGKSDNSYNWGSRLTHDVELTTYETEDAFYVKMSVHREGDVRGNYTNDFLLVFDTEEQFYEEILESQSNNCNYVEIDGKSYRIEADFFSEYCNIWCEDDQKSWDDVVCTDIDELKELIATDEGTQY